MDAATRYNVLGDVILDIAFATEEEAFAENRELGNFIKSKLLSIIDEVFNQLGSDNIYYFETLDLDLGEMTYTGYQEEIEHRLRERLHALLLSRLPTAQADTSADTRVISKQRNNLEILTYFIDHGRLPWKATLPMVQGIEPLTNQVLQESFSDLVDFFNKKNPTEIAMLSKRLAGQLSEDTLKKLVARLAPTLSDFINQLNQILVQVTTDERDKFASHENVIRQEYWTSLLSFLLQPDKKILSRREVIKHLLLNISSRLLKRVKTQHSNIKAADHMPNNLHQEECTEHELLLEFKAHVRRLHIQTHSKQSHHSEEHEGTVDVSRMQPSYLTDSELITLINSLLQRNQGANIAVFWQQLLERPPVLRKLLKRLCVQQNTRLQFSNYLPENILFETVSTLDKGCVNVIRELATQLDTIQQASYPLPNIPLSTSRPVFWLFTLSHLVLEDQNRFEIASYLDSIIRQFTAQFGLSRHQISTAWSEIRESLHLTQMLHNSISQSLENHVTGIIARQNKVDTAEQLECPPKTKAIAKNNKDHGVHTQPLQDIEANLNGPLENIEAAISELRQDAGALDKFIDQTPEHLLEQLLARLRDIEHSGILECADIIIDAGISADYNIEPGTVRLLKWQFIIGQWLKSGLQFNLESFAQKFTSTLLANISKQDAANKNSARYERSQVLAKLIQHLPALVNAENRKTVMAIQASLVELEDIEKHLNHHLTHDQHQDRIHSEPPSWKTDTISESEIIYVDNAGLILASPYLPRLFDMLGLIQDGSFRNLESAERAVHILQYLSEGEAPAPEHHLMLNKILCGLPLAMPIDSNIELQRGERDVADGLLLGIIQNWKTIGNTSINGLRTSFIQREGSLQIKNEDWHLIVAPKSFDMLLDSLPWSIAVIRHRWMTRTLYTAWR